METPAVTNGLRMLGHCENIIIQLRDLFNSNLQGIDAIKDKIQHFYNTVLQTYKHKPLNIKVGGRRKSHRRNRKSHRKTRSRTRQIR